MSDLDRLLGPDLVSALERLVDLRVAAALESSRRREEREPPVAVGR